MQADRSHFRIVISLVVATCTLTLPALCDAQWVPNPGEGTVSLGYQYTRITKHLFSHDVSGMLDPASGYVGGPGKQYYMGDIFGQTVDLTADYGVGRGLGVSANAAYVNSKYSGLSPEGPQDGGQYHGGLQDASFNVEYMIPWKEFAITPSMGARFPIRNYSTMGHVAVGKGLREFPIGISMGRSLDPLLPRAYLAGSFAYSFVQNHHEHSLDQRHYEVDAGYILTNSLSVGGSLQYLDTVDGFDWYTDDLSGTEAWNDHDADAKTKYLRAGGSASYSLGRNFGLTLSYVGTITGENTHSGQSVTFAPTWKFRTPLAR